jgi:transposase
MIIMASATGMPRSAIARLVAADEDTVRDVVHLFDQKGLAALDPQWAGDRPRLISDDDIALIVKAATTRPEKLGLLFTHWRLRKLAAYLASAPRLVVIGRERLRQLLHGRGISFQRTRTWKESTDPDREAKLDRIEYVTTRFPDRRFAFDQFGPLSIRPEHASSWAREKRPARLRATYRRTQGIRYFHGCYALADDQLWGVTRERKGDDHTLAALKSIRAPQPGGYRLYVILDNLSANKTPAIRRWGRARQRRALLHPDGRILGEPDRGPVRAAPHLCHGRLRPPQPCRPGPQAAGLPGLAQRQRPPSRHRGRPAPRTRPHPQPAPATLGTPDSTPPDPVNVSGHRTRREREGVRPLRITTG